MKLNPGDYALLFEKATSGWWLGRKEESLQIFIDLIKEDLPENYKGTIKWNINRIDPDAAI